VAGSLPPLIGWHFVSPEFNIVPVILFLIIFLWTPPHFWALSLKTKEEYAKAGIPMMPITHGNKSTKKQMLFYSLLLLLVTDSLYFIGYSSVIFLIASTMLSSYFVYLCYRLYKDSEDKIAMKVFYYSIFYLFAIFMLLIIDIKIKLLL
jgi:protoheme IX farnesyltransferase